MRVVGRSRRLGPDHGSRTMTTQDPVLSKSEGMDEVEWSMSHDRFASFPDNICMYVLT